MYGTIAARLTRAVLSAVLVGLALAVVAVPAQGASPEAATNRQQGMSYIPWQGGAYRESDVVPSLAIIAETGSEWISLIVNQYQDNINSTTIYRTDKTLTDDQVAYVITQAHNLGLKVMLKPHVNLRYDPTHWRGQIGINFTKASQWTAWFTSYRNFINHYAALAHTHNVDQFCIGTELWGTARQSTHWRNVAADVRARYSGPITYAANHSGEETLINWWDVVDYIGVDAYYPLTDKNDPTIEELKAAWQPHLTTLSNLASTWGRSVLFTEVGYRSQDGANRAPWDSEEVGQIDLQEQADAYQAVFEEVYTRSWFAGMFWWSWGQSLYEGGHCDSDFTPKEKPAENILRTWYGAQPRESGSLSGLGGAEDPTEKAEIYLDALGPGWVDWSYDSSHNLAASDQVYEGARSISASLQPWGAISFGHQPIDSSPYDWVEFYIRGGTSGTQHLQIFFDDDSGAELRKCPVDHPSYVPGGTIEAGTWKKVIIPLDHLAADNRYLTRITIQDRAGLNPAFWVDSIQLKSAMAIDMATLTPQVFIPRIQISR